MLDADDERDKDFSPKTLPTEIWDGDSFLKMSKCVFQLTKWNDCGKSPAQT